MGTVFFFEYEVVPGITLVKELKEQGRDLVCQPLVKG